MLTKRWPASRAEGQGQTTRMVKHGETMAFVGVYYEPGMGLNVEVPCKAW